MATKEGFECAGGGMRPGGPEAYRDGTSGLSVESARVLVTRRKDYPIITIKEYFLHYLKNACLFSFFLAALLQFLRVPRWVITLFGEQKCAENQQLQVFAYKTKLKKNE